MNPLHERVSVIICAQNEQATLAQLLMQIKAIPEWKETIVVVNGSTDRTQEIVEEAIDTTLISYKEPLGHDVGRALGAMKATGDILLFVDGDMVIPTEELYPFVCAVATGVDLALNDLMPLLPKFEQWDAVSLVKAFLNSAAGREDLRANSMTAVPHALSRRAVQKFGAKSLVVPPLMQAKMMIEQTMRIAAVTSVDVIRRNRIRPYNVGSLNRVGEMIVGDHIEALHYLITELGIRGSFADTNRNRNAFADYLKK